jgi:hypothetical protein
MKCGFAAVVVLVVASSAASNAHAQGQPMRASTSVPYYGGNASTGGSSAFSGGATIRPLTYEAPRELPLVYGVNDGPFVPSTFMKYDDALALGKEQIAEQEARANMSLGEVARSYRAEKVPTMQLQNRVVQDNAGKLKRLPTHLTATNS